jgi:hypothetical protein
MEQCPYPNSCDVTVSQDYILPRLSEAFGRPFTAIVKIANATLVKAKLNSATSGQDLVKENSRYSGVLFAELVKFSL